MCHWSKGLLQRIPWYVRIIFSASSKNFLSFTNFTGDDEVTETATEAPAVTEPAYWVCDIDWHHTYYICIAGLCQDHYNLADIWGPSGPGNGQDQSACYKESKCRHSNDANGRVAISDICEKTYEWYREL